MRIQDIVVNHGRHRVFEGLSGSFSTGKWCLLGPNGAGKSTLMSAAAGFLPTKSGSFQIDNVTLSKHRSEYLKQVGWMPQEINTVGGLTVLEYIEYAGWLKGVSKPQLKPRALEVAEAVDLTKLLNRKSNKLSGGETKRLGLAAALIHNPSVLLLDEPTAGMDPIQRRNFFRVIETLPESTTVLVSTHEIHELDSNYTHLAVLSRGRFVFSGPIDLFLQAGQNGETNPVVLYEKALNQ
ncbi:MAG: hypothetical protein RL038_361 [Actinomycetota bacterium]|jgi:ABC-2 type transport system ATP-binding protein